MFQHQCLQALHVWPLDVAQPTGQSQQCGTMNSRDHNTHAHALTIEHAEMYIHTYMCSSHSEEPDSKATQDQINSFTATSWSERSNAIWNLLCVIAESDFKRATFLLILYERTVSMPMFHAGYAGELYTVYSIVFNSYKRGVKFYDVIPILLCINSGGINPASSMSEDACISGSWLAVPCSSKFNILLSICGQCVNITYILRI